LAAAVLEGGIPGDARSDIGGCGNCIGIPARRRVKSPARAISQGRSRHENTQHSSGAIATGKALTAVNFRRATRVFQDGIAAGGEGLRFLAVPGVTPLEGGFPIVVNDRVVGGIGVSGVLSQQDVQVAQAGLAAL
jgi:uncharacterized protein GlcG (DUF336 family)